MSREGLNKCSSKDSFPIWVKLWMRTWLIFLCSSTSMILVVRGVTSSMESNGCISNSFMRSFEIFHSSMEALVVAFWVTCTFLKKGFQVLNTTRYLSLSSIEYTGSVVGGDLWVYCQLRILSRASFASWYCPTRPSVWVDSLDQPVFYWAYWEILFALLQVSHLALKLGLW